MKTAVKLIILVCSIVIASKAQNSAPSAHFNMTVPNHDIRVAQFRVPSGYNPSASYYQVTGFWGHIPGGSVPGNTGSGYGGIQNSQGNNVHIFSIWHSMSEEAIADTANFPYAVYLGHGQDTHFFRGEGVGLRTMNRHLGWETDIWYTSVARVWSKGDESHYGYFYRDGVNGKWRHLTTIAVRHPGLRFSGTHNFFIEDWLATGSNAREMHFRNSLVRDLSGNWSTTSSGRYSVNSWDLGQGGRSYNYRTNWNAGLRGEGSEQYYFMRSGGDNTSPEIPLSSSNTAHTFSLSAGPEKSDAEFPKALITGMGIEYLNDFSSLEINWTVDSLALPQFSYTISVFDNENFSGYPLIQKSRIQPQRRNDILDITGFDIVNKKYFVKLEIEDIFDNVSEPQTASFGEGEIEGFITVTNPVGNNVYVIGDTVRVEWQTNIANQFEISLVNRGSIIETIGTTDSDFYDWIISSDLDEGNEFSISVTGGDVSAVTSAFTIEHPDSTFLQIDRAHVSVYSVSSEQASAGETGAMAIDGYPETFWHTAYNDETHPHYIILRLDSTFALSGLSYLPRQNGQNGRIAEFGIEVSLDGEEWERRASGEWPNGTEIQVVSFTDVSKARYVRLTAYSEVNGGAWASVAGLELFHDALFGDDVSAQLDGLSGSKRGQSTFSASGVIHIHNTPANEIRLYSLSGRLMLTQKLNPQKQNRICLAQNGIARGAYLMQLLENCTVTSASTIVY
ncbi:hypothetical protein CHISP_3309 [Chitinispirillum alkaliphilum]|nr:hypothetical protein CHISP_3309 [Chitinispirillum alkaliphilum]